MGENVIEFVNGFEFGGFFGIELIGFLAIEEGFEALLEVVGELK